MKKGFFTNLKEKSNSLLKINTLSFFTFYFTLKKGAFRLLKENILVNMPTAALIDIPLNSYWLEKITYPFISSKNYTWLFYYLFQTLYKTQYYTQIISFKNTQQSIIKYIKNL